MIILGSSGSGKSNCVVKPTLCRTWGGTFAALDIKGELKAEYDKKKDGRQAKVITFREEEGGCSFDIYQLFRQGGTDNLLSNVREFVNSLIQLPLTVLDPFWIEATRGYLIAGIFYYYDLGLSFIEAIDYIMLMLPGVLIRKIGRSKNTTAKMFVKAFLTTISEKDNRLILLTKIQKY